MYLGKYFQGCWPAGCGKYAEMPLPLVSEALHILDPARCITYNSR